MRTTHKRVGLSCRAVQLLSNALQQQCCEDCHAAKRNLGSSSHNMVWANTPGAPKEFDPGMAFVCCSFARVIARAVKYGWEKSAEPKVTMVGNYATTDTISYTANVTSATSTNVTLIPKDTVGWLLGHPTSVGAHLSPEVKVKVITSTPSFNSDVLEAVGGEHLPVHNVQIAATTDLYCLNPACRTCGEDDTSYWSFKMQCWIPMDRYSLLDNAMQLSMHHAIAHKDAQNIHLCSHLGLHSKGLTYIPEYDALSCRTQHGEPAFGAQYGVRPIFVAVIHWDDGGFRYVSHGWPIPANLMHLLYMTIGEEKF